MMDLTTIFCDVDDFCKEHVMKERVEKKCLGDGKRHRNRARSLSCSEIMTLLICFHASHYRNFKHFYQDPVSVYWREFFPRLVSYNRLVEMTPTVLLPLWAYLKSRLDTPTGISYVDSRKVAVCGTKRISRNRVFSDTAKLGKSSMGWFFGFKLHLIINEKGGLLAVKITTGNEDDRSPVRAMTEGIRGQLFGDKGYLSHQLFEDLLQRGLQLITTIKKNMKNRLMPLVDKILLRKRSIIETVNGQLKNISPIEPTRHRSPFNFMVNIVCGLIAYNF